MDDVFKGLDTTGFGDEKTPAMMPFFVHEAEMARMERTQKRLWVLCIIIFLALVVTNAGWIMYESQFTDEVITQEITQDSRDSGSNSYNGNIIAGDNYGEAEDKNNGQETY